MGYYAGMSSRISTDNAAKIFLCKCIACGGHHVLCAESLDSG
jgi:hypothetical protein